MRINKGKLEIIMGEQGLNTSKLAKKSGVSRQSISFIRTGKNCNQITAGKIAKALNVPLSDLLD